MEDTMKTVTVNLGDRKYPIYIGAGLLAQPQLLTDHIRGKRVLVVTNETIAPLYLDKCAAARLCKLSSESGPPRRLRSPCGCKACAMLQISLAIVNELRRRVVVAASRCRALSCAGSRRR